MQLAVHGSVLTRLLAAVETPPFEPQQNTVLTPGPEGRLVFSGFHVPTGVTVSFSDGAGDIVITSRGALTIDGSIDAGARSLTFNAESVSFGPAYSVTGSGANLSINTPTFSPGTAGNLRGNVFLNGARLATGESPPGESYGAVTRFIATPIVQSGGATALPSAGNAVTLQQPAAVADWNAFAISADESTRFVQGPAATGGALSVSGTGANPTITVTSPGWNSAPQASGAVPWVTASTGRIELRDPVGTISNANSVVGSNAEGPSSLVVTALAAPPAPFRFASLEVTAVPEPGAWALLLVGAAALLLRHRLRRQRKGKSDEITRIPGQS